ncbi:MAG: hypothetical protein H6706_21345 [Myxococcales bacterium]|nr:hypothetical protein [Myxococcales bacterium]
MKPWALALLATAACDAPDEACGGEGLAVLPEAVQFGDVRPRAADDPGDPARLDQVPTRRVVLLRNTCAAPLTLTEICLIADAHNGDAADPAFFLELPAQTRLAAGETAAVRVTYDHLVPNADADLDGERDPGAAILVIQSSAAGTPTRVVPVCGRIVPEGEEATPTDCPPPFTIPRGEAIADLCSR